MLGGVYFGMAMFGSITAAVLYVPVPAAISSKSATEWANNDVKASDVWRPAEKQSHEWDAHVHRNQWYMFDDRHIAFDERRYLFDSILNENVNNQRNQSTWDNDIIRTPTEYTKPEKEPTEWSFR